MTQKTSTHRQQPFVRGAVHALRRLSMDPELRLEALLSPPASIG
jgi:hypothetical protein